MRKVIVLGCVLAAIAITLNSASEISIVGRGQHIADNLAIIRLVLDPECACSFRFHLPFNYHRKRESECRALAGLRLDPDPAPVHLDNAFGYCES
jgi:hypothetical protein